MRFEDCRIADHAGHSAEGKSSLSQWSSGRISQTAYGFFGISVLVMKDRMGGQKVAAIINGRLSRPDARH